MKIGTISLRSYYTKQRVLDIISKVSNRISDVKGRYEKI